MVRKQPLNWFLFFVILSISIPAVAADMAGSIRGIVYDKDFDAPLADAVVLIHETNQKVQTNQQGNFLLNNLQPGNYTVGISKEGYARQLKSNVIVSGGQMTEIEIYLSGEFTEMEEFVVQDVQISTGTEAALLDLRMEQPALMDSVSSELMSQAGASDAASALKLVAGATVQDGKYAVVRGLPDRYVNSQMNGVRLPTADADKRAVQLDQFPSTIIDSIQVSKTFTPDQQGDASGGAVNIVLKGIPDETFLKLEYGMASNSQTDEDFLKPKNSRMTYWSKNNYAPQLDKTSSNQPWDGPGGFTSGSAPLKYKWSTSAGGKFNLTDDIRIGGFGSFFYNTDVSYREGVDDKYWIDDNGLATNSNKMVPVYSGDRPGFIDGDVPKTSLYDITKSSYNVQWGGLGILGIETDNHKVNFLYMMTHDATESVTRAIDSRGKTTAHNYFEVDPIGLYDLNKQDYEYPALHRNETLSYTERTTQTYQLNGRHTIEIPEIGINKIITFLSPEIDWTIAKSKARLYQPDKMVVSSTYREKYNRFMFRSSSTAYADINRVWKDIEESSDQYFVNIKLPFEQWSGDEGYFKFGIFNDSVRRTYDQDSYNFAGGIIMKNGVPFETESLGDLIDGQATMTAFDQDIDYVGTQKIDAWYYMLNLPVTSYFSIIGGHRFENTNLQIENTADSTNTKFISSKDNDFQQVFFNDTTKKNVDIAYRQKDILPSIGFEFKPSDQFTVRGSYTETVARQTFKELSPIQQQDYFGDDIFSGNPSLKMSSLKNWDMRIDYTPYKGSLISASYFYKDVVNPIEYVQINTNYGLSFTRPFNYPKGKISGYEFEIRQQLGHFWDSLEGIDLGANATFINSEVTLPEDEAYQLAAAGKSEPTRDMMNTPKFLYNIYATYDIKDTGTKLGAFYTVRGDTLVAGASATKMEGAFKKNYVPSVYETEYGTLNFSVTQKIGEDWNIKFQAKNVLNPKIQSVYRSKYTDRDYVKTSYTKGVDLSLSVGATF